MTREEISQRLNERDILPTVQRLDIAELIIGEPKHMSADQIIDSLRRKGARVSKATVYNTLNLFCERKLLRTVEVDPVRQYYDSRTEPHHHFYNVDTGELIDIPFDAVELNVQAPLPPGTFQDGAEVVIRVRDA